MQNTRKVILATALECFNSEGVADVSIGRIGISGNIAKGNIHYYFKTKRALLETLYFRLHADLCTLWEPVLAGNISLKEFLLQINAIIGKLFPFRFLYQQKQTVFRLSPLIHETWSQAEKDRKKSLRNLFRQWSRDASTFRKEIESGEYSFLAANVFFFIENCMTDFTDKPDSVNSLEEIQSRFDFLLLPYLTSEARKRFLKDED